MNAFFAYLILALLPLFFAGAKPNSAPGIQKKSLEILNVVVVKSGTGATIYWETNLRSDGSVAIEDYAIADEVTGTRHSVAIPYLIAGIPYEFTLYSYSAIYGSAPPYAGSFTL